MWAAHRWGAEAYSSICILYLCVSLPPPTVDWTLASQFLAQLSIELCCITETLESQVAGMCTIDLFHCGSQQWLFAPQHTAPQEEPGQCTETQSLQTERGCPSLSCSLSQFIVLLRVFGSVISGLTDMLVYEHTHTHKSTKLGFFLCVCVFSILTHVLS